MCAYTASYNGRSPSMYIHTHSLGIAVYPSGPPRERGLKQSKLQPLSSKRFILFSCGVI